MAHDLKLIENSIINDLRYNITDPKSRGSSTTETFDGDNSTTTFTLSNPARALYIEVDGTEQKFGTEYTINDDATQVTFTTPPANGTDNISIAYKYGTTWIYPDFSKDQITLADFPRISCSIISSSTERTAISGDVFKSTFIISITVAASTRNQVNETIKDIRTRLLSRRKSFGLFTMLEPSSESAIQNSGLHDRIMQRTIDFFVPYTQEVL